jgi:hypothetical protein
MKPLQGNDYTCLLEMYWNFILKVSDCVDGLIFGKYSDMFCRKKGICKSK